MECSKPLIAILMALYNPRTDWLEEQLLSLNDQTYPVLEIYICDDCSDRISYDEIEAIVNRCITRFPYHLYRNSTNLGSNKTFERLTKEADGVYFAYCDQDDIWLEHKIELLKSEIESSHALLVCSDVIPIDKNGRQIGNSIKDFRPRHIFCSGNGLAETLIYRNFVIGCTMLIDAKTARMAVPFAVSMVHDHYLAFVCALHGSIVVMPQPLVKYRMHDDNQTSVLAGIVNKDDYKQKHISSFCKRVSELSDRFELKGLTLAEEWSGARLKNADRRPGGAYSLYKLRGVNRTTSWFEMIALRMPSPLFTIAVRLIQSGKI